MTLTFAAETVRIEAQDRIRELVQTTGACLKASFGIVGRRLQGMKPGRVKQIYYGEANLLRAEEMDAIRDLHARLSIVIEKQRAIERYMQGIMGDARVDHPEADGLCQGAGRDEYREGGDLAGPVLAPGSGARPADGEG